MLNRRGHLPTIMLLVIGFLLMGVSWFVFISANADLKPYLSNIGYLTDSTHSDYSYVVMMAPRVAERAIALSSKNNFEQDFRYNFNKEASRIESLGVVSGNFFGKIRNNDYNVTQENGFYVLRVNDVFVSSQSGQNKITRTFDITVKLDVTGQ